MATEQDGFPPVGQLSNSQRRTLIRLLRFVFPQLTARLELLDEHPRFTTPSGLGDDTRAFTPEKSASFSPPSLRGQLPSYHAALGGSDHFLAHRATKEPVDCSNSYSSFDESGTGLNALEEPLESSHYMEEPPPFSFGDIRDINIVIKVKEHKSSERIKRAAKCSFSCGS